MIKFLIRPPILTSWLPLRVVLIALTALFSYGTAVCRAQVAKLLPIGSSVPTFHLTDTDGVVHTPDDWKSSQILAVVFLCNHCTESQIYESRVNKFAQDYASKGVAVVAIQSSNPHSFSEDDLAWSDVGETLADMKERATFRKFSFPYLYDGETGSTAIAFGATVAPAIYVFDKDRKLRYSGRIDDDPANGPATKREAEAAIEALLAGRSVSVATTSAKGCALRLGIDKAIKQKQDDGPVNVSLATTTALSALRHNQTNKLLFVNFYATWCGPCVTEFPDLMATNRMYRGRNFSFTTISSNVPAEKPQVLQFLEKMHATTSNLLYSSDDVYAMQEAFDPDVGSAVPVSVLIAPGGKLLLDQQGEIDLMQIRRAILANLPDEPGHEGSQKYWSTK